MSISIHTGSNELVQRELQLKFRLMPEGKDYYPILSFKTDNESLDMFPDMKQVYEIYAELGKLIDQYSDLKAEQL
jgi:hypothetical protein